MEHLVQAEKIFEFGRQLRKVVLSKRNVTFLLNLKRKGVIKKGDHVVAIGDNDQDDWQHGIFIGTSEGIVNFGTEKQSVSEIEDLLTFVKNRSLVRINYKMKCLDPLETSYFAQQKEYFVPRDSAAHNAIKCKIGKSEPNEILRLLPKNIQSLMQKANQPDILQLLRKCIDEILWFWK